MLGKTPCIWCQEETSQPVLKGEAQRLAALRSGMENFSKPHRRAIGRAVDGRCTGERPEVLVHGFVFWTVSEQNLNSSLCVCVRRSGSRVRKGPGGSPQWHADLCRAASSPHFSGPAPQAPPLRRVTPTFVPGSEERAAQDVRGRDGPASSKRPFSQRALLSPSV